MFDHEDWLLYPSITTRDDFDHEADYRLFIAVIKGKLFTVNSLMHNNANPHAQHKRCYLTAIHAALSRRDSDVASRKKLEKLLSNSKYFPNELGVYLQEETHTPICMAIRQAKFQCIALLLSYQAQHIICTKKFSNNLYCYPLVDTIQLTDTYATYREAYALLKTLLSHPKFNQRAYYFLKFLSFIEAKNKGHKITEGKIDKAANQKLESIYNRVLLKLVNSELPFCPFEALLSLFYKKMLAFRCNERWIQLMGTTFLGLWVKGTSLTSKRKTEIVELLLKRLKGNINILDSYGENALHLTLKYNALGAYHTPLAQYLIDQGVNINQQNNSSNTILHQVCIDILLKDSNHTSLVNYQRFLTMHKRVIQPLIQVEGVALGLKNANDQTPFEMLPENYQNYIKQSLDQHIYKIIETLGLNQPDQNGHVLCEKRQKMAADVWRALGRRNQMILCHALALECPDLTSKYEDIKKLAWSYLQAGKEIAFSYLPKNITSSLTTLSTVFSKFPFKGEQYLRKPRFPQEIELEIMQRIFADRLIEQDYGFLGISKEEKKSLNITQEGLLFILSKSMQSNLKPAPPNPVKLQSAQKILRSC